ncbi:MAG: family 10 glycosylhydrolase [Bacteroidota bacterium]|nr:family 10 glycosylhydrolase [Bacteroidota bacterium]
MKRKQKIKMAIRLFFCDFAQRDILFLFLFTFSTLLIAQSPKHELRAVWISSAGGDWPKSTDVVEQQRALVKILDNLKKHNFNTVFFQVRPRGNTFYKSSIEPWAAQLSGVLGKDPGWDPLEFAIEESRKRGLQLHAWFNVAKVWGSDNLPQDQQHITRAHRNWIQQVENEWWVDMGNPDVREYTENLVKEIVNSYDIDGIHFDFIRYPSEKFDDWKSFRTWSDGMDRSNWRRNNITSFIRTCYEFIHEEKPWIKVGATPLGIYQSINGAQSMFNGYSGVFQDSRWWLSEGILDYVVPQLYWTIGEQKNPNDPDFEALCNDWVRENYGRHVYAGIGSYRDNIQEEIREQIDVTRNTFAEGQAFFRYEHAAYLIDQIGEAYRFPALVPRMVWKDSIPPNAPKNISIDRNDRFDVLIKWSESEISADKEEARTFVVYRSSVKNIDIQRSENILSVVPASQFSFRDETTNGKEYFYSVTAVDRAGNESGETEHPLTGIQTIFSRYSKAKTSVTLVQNFPNPVVSTTYIAFEIPQRNLISLNVKHTVTQQETTIVQGMKESGIHIVAFDAKKFSAGLIEYRLHAGEAIITKMMEKK